MSFLTFSWTGYHIQMTHRFCCQQDEQTEIIGFIRATTVTTIHYLATKALVPQAASRHLQSLLSFFVIASVNLMVLENAIASQSVYIQNFKCFGTERQGFQQVCRQGYTGAKGARFLRISTSAVNRPVRQKDLPEVRQYAK